MATLDDIDLYGDGLATELNVTQTSYSIKQEPAPPVVVVPQIKQEPYLAPPQPQPAVPAVKVWIG